MALSQSTGPTSRFLNQLRNGDPNGRKLLVEYASDRLRLLAQRMLRTDYRRVARFENSDDVYQEAQLRLHKALSKVPKTSVHFWRMVGTLIRRSLIDMIRHYYGPFGIGTNQHAERKGESAEMRKGIFDNLRDHRIRERSDSGKLALLHELVEKLPEKEKKVIDLLVYAEMQQKEAAAELGISLRTLKRINYDARQKLSNWLKSELRE
jgi:RNA polymerase sigma factor (sigma-70 family)